MTIIGRLPPYEHSLLTTSLHLNYRGQLTFRKYAVFNMQPWISPFKEIASLFAYLQIKSMFKCNYWIIAGKMNVITIST